MGTVGQPRDGAKADPAARRAQHLQILGLSGYLHVLQVVVKQLNFDGNRNRLPWFFSPICISVPGDIPALWEVFFINLDVFFINFCIPHTSSRSEGKILLFLVN